MRRRTSIWIFLRRSPSTLPSSWMALRMRETSSSVRSFTRMSGLTPAFPSRSLERESPMP